MKALVLAGGRGVRIASRPGSPKCMLAVSGKPLIEHSLDRAVDVGVTEIVAVVAPHAREIPSRFGTSYRGTPLTWVQQSEPLGTVDAMACARGALGGMPFFLLLADEIVIGGKHAALLDRFRSDDLFAACGVVRVRRSAVLARNYLVVPGTLAGEVATLHEKPTIASSDRGPWWMGTGLCAMRAEILDYAPRVRVHPVRGEKELPDLIQAAVEDGRRVGWLPIARRYVNVNSPEDLRQARRLLTRSASTR
jgi:NDP-sugar pyrophosphorylase family protein